MALAAANDTHSPVRTLAHVLLELSEADRERTAADRCCAAAAPNSAEEIAACDRFAKADDRISELSAEAKKMIGDATGMSWARIEAAITAGWL